MTTEKPFDFKAAFPELSPPRARRPRTTSLTQSLPDRAPIPEMTLPDGRRYRWESEDGAVYKWFEYRRRRWDRVGKGSRRDAIEFAKTLRKAGGTHPYRSVVQLVARCFPLDIQLAIRSDFAAAGGPGSSYLCSVVEWVELLISVTDETSLAHAKSCGGYGTFKVVAVQTPLTREALADAIGRLKAEVATPFNTMVTPDADDAFETIWARAPWIA